MAPLGIIFYASSRETLFPRHGSGSNRAKDSIAATATPGTQLWLLSEARLRELGKQPSQEIDAEPLDLLENWISAISAAASGAAPPKSFMELKSGSVLEIDGEPKPVMPAKGILWIEHLKGSSRFLNRNGIDPIAGKSYFPVSAQGWLQPQPQTTVISRDSQEWEKADPEWRSLQPFHRTVQQCLIANRRVQDDKDRKRLLNQAGAIRRN